MRIITKDECFTLLQTAEQPSHKALISTLWNTGHRISEIILLKRSDIWYDDEWLYFRFKVLKRGRDKITGIPKEFIHTIKIPVKASFIEYIKDWIDSCTEELVFDFTRQYANRIIAKLCKDNNIEHIHAHDFRHTLATRLAERGANKYEMETFFGWTGWDTSSIYVKRGTALIENIAKKID